MVELAKERARREAAEVAHSKQIKEHLSIMREMLEWSTTRDEHVSVESATPHDKLVLAHFIEGDDIEAFLTTFERLMAVYHIEESVGREVNVTALRQSSTSVCSHECRRCSHIR